eukprot:CAMPEP_0176496016 /NCGR_PEP_ID=MMETSP0200_2-20121128/10975_1 /TAXON_ID=947934 /ORGANISM="Chaetoceros sp., Strain GSL56" /LENGTH=68 /DNA_ID=CAMNT_0017893953 /DNA_START=1278 /DNA_END=1481 /DNA_ORIENTATION=+
MKFSVAAFALVCALNHVYGAQEAKVVTTNQINGNLRGVKNGNWRKLYSTSVSNSVDDSPDSPDSPSMS